MHGYIDSFPVPIHLDKVGPSKSQQNKGKEKAKNQQSSGDVYDVVAEWTPAESDLVQRKVQLAAQLGYSTVVLTLNILPTTNPAALSFPTPLFPRLDPRTAPANTPNLILQLWRIHVVDYSDEAIKAASVKGYYGFSNATALLFPPSTSLLSCSPTSLSAFSHTCISLAPPSPYSPTLISIDPSLNPRLPFPLKRGMVNTLQRAGAMIEIVTRGLVRQDEVGEGGASQRRRNWIAGAREIVRACGGKAIVLSSGALKPGEQRATEDLINLCSLIGLTPSQAKDALTINPQRAILRGLALRQTYRGVLSNPSLVVSSANEALAAPASTTSASLASSAGGLKRDAGAVEESAKADAGGASAAQQPKPKKKKQAQAVAA